MKRILIIEDDALTARIYRTHLEKAGYEVDVAFDGENGCTRLVSFRPDGVLMDLMMPRMGGIELVKRIRNTAQFQGLPIVAYTNAFIPAMVEQVLAAGANTVLDKATVTPSLLISVLQQAMSSTPTPPRSG